MESSHRKALVIGILLSISGFFLFKNTVKAEMLKLVDTPLNQVIELYARKAQKNVFVDETVQQNRKVNIHLQDMGIEEAFGIIQKTMGLESALIGTKTVLLFPVERAQRYKPGMKPLILHVPTGLDPKWVSVIISTLFPAVKTATAPGDNRAIVIFGPNTQVEDAQNLANTLPELAFVQETFSMTLEEAKLLIKEIRLEGVELEPTPNGLFVKGPEKALEIFKKKYTIWQEITDWTTEIYTPVFLDPQKAIKVTEAAKGRTIVSDLGGTGAILIDGPKADCMRLMAILEIADKQARPSRLEVSIGEMKPETAKEAIKIAGLRIESAGDRRMVLIGKEQAIENAAEIIKTLGQKKTQILVRFRLAEISRTRLKTLGIDLDKSIYSYGEIKGFQPNDTLPLLLRVIEEGKDARILAEPNLRVIEGEEAKVTIGDKIPLEVAATAQTESGSTLKLNTQLSWVEVGIKMTVRNVTINADNSIRMNLKGEVSSVVGTTKQGYPQIRTREAESILRVNNGGSVIMGGLISQEERDEQNRIPWISKIPLFGGFARSRNKQKGKTEVIMVVTAKVAED